MKLHHITPLRSYIAFSKDGSLWNPIKRVLFSTKKWLCCCYKLKNPFLVRIRTIYLKSACERCLSRMNIFMPVKTSLVCKSLSTLMTIKTVLS